MEHELKKILNKIKTQELIKIINIINKEIKFTKEINTPMAMGMFRIKKLVENELIKCEGEINE